MWEIIMSLTCGGLFYLLVIQITQCVTVGLMGGVPEEEAEDETKKMSPHRVADGTGSKGIIINLDIFIISPKTQFVK